MKRCDLLARELRLLDPLFVHPSTILGQERVIVVNLEQLSDSDKAGCYNCCIAY